MCISLYTMERQMPKSRLSVPQAYEEILRQHYEHEHRLPSVLDALQYSTHYPTTTILDLGAGTGRYTIPLVYLLSQRGTSSNFYFIDAASVSWTISAPGFLQGGDYERYSL